MNRSSHAAGGLPTISGDYSGPSVSGTLMMCLRECFTPQRKHASLQSVVVSTLVDNGRIRKYDKDNNGILRRVILRDARCSARYVNCMNGLFYL
jgi:hypothetical protein